MFGTKSRLFAILAAALLGTFICSMRAQAATSSAEKLVNVVPDDVVGFVATSGGDELKPAFEKTILGRMWNDPGVQSFCQEVKKAFLQKARREARDDKAKAIDMWVELAGLFLKRPIIVGAARKKAKEGLPVYGFAIVDAGPRKAEIAAAWAKFEATAGEGEIVEIEVGGMKMHGLSDASEMPRYWGWVGKRFVFAINDGEGLAMKYLQGKIRRLTPGYLKDVRGSGDALAVYIDREKVFEVLGAVAGMEGSGDEFGVVRTAVKELGLANIRTLAGRMGFSGPDVVSDELIKLRGRRTGLLACLGTIELSMFDMVDAGALSTSAVNCDFGRVYDTIMRAVRAASPEDAYPEIQEGIAELEREAKISIRKGLLESLAGPTVSYTLPAGVMMDAPMGGVVVIGKLKDAGLWERTMTNLGHFATTESEGMVQVSFQVQEGRTLHCWVIAPLAMMQVMPTLTIVDNHVVIGSNIALCNKAVKQVVSAKRLGLMTSIRTTEGYRKVTAKLPRELVFFSYTNSQLQFNQMMISLQQFWPMINMFAGQAGMRLPFMLPSLGHISKDMGPCCQYSWFDGEGLRCRYRGPGVEPSIGAAAGASIVGVATLMPALTKTRDSARQAVSLSNMHQMAIILNMYSADHKGKLPKTLEETVPDYCAADSKLFESPRKPKGFTGPSYIYIPHETANIRKASHYIVVYENPEFCEDKIGVLLLDYSVRAMRRQEFLKALKETYKFLGEEMPEIGFKGGRGGVVESVELPPRVVSGSNLSGIGKACMVYSNEDKEGRFPPNLDKLVELDYITAKRLESPLKPKGFDGPSYMYVAGQSSAMNPGNIVAYENPGFCSDEINVVFLDGHVEVMKPAEFMRKLEETYKRLGWEMPEIRFKGDKEGLSISNLHHLSLVLKVYSDGHKGKMPRTLEEAKHYYRDERILESPRKPNDFDGPSYIYIQHETPNIKGAGYYIVVYENPEFCEDKIPILFLDYSVRAMRRGEFLAALEKTYKFLGKEMPEIKFKGDRRGGAAPRVLRGVE